MAVDHDTPFDRVLAARPSQLPELPKTPIRQSVFRSQGHQRWRHHLADACYLAIKGTAFAASSLAMTLGLPLAFFLALSGWHLDMLFTQIENLSGRYLAADGARRTAFADLVEIGFIGMFALIAIWRLPRFINDVGQGLAAGRADA